MILRNLAIAAIGLSVLASCKDNKNEAANKDMSLKNETDSLSYSLGVSVGSGMQAQGITDLNTEILGQAISDFLNGSAKLDNAKANEIIGIVMEKKRKEKADKATAASKTFLEENAKNPDVVTTASGLQYIVINPGSGDKPAETDKVKVHYHGTLVDGTVFDSSVDRGEPVTFPVNGVIRGWVEALQLMPIGSKYKLFIPSELAYGERGAGQMIGPNETLIFEVELLDIVKE